MRKVSEILGKNIISLYEGKRIGIIENVAFDRKLKKLRSFVIYDEDNDINDRLFVPSASVKLEGENAVIIRNLEKVIEDTKNQFSKNNPINANVYNLSGNLLGKVKEILIYDDIKEIHSLVLNDNTEILQTQIVSSDFKTIIIKGLTEDAPVLSAPKRKPTPPIEKKPANIGVVEPEQKPISFNKDNEQEPVVKVNKISRMQSAEAAKKVSQPKLIIKTIKIDELKTAGEIEQEPDLKPPEAEFSDYKNNEDGLKTNYDLNNTEFLEEKIIPLNLRRCSANFGFLIGRRVEYDVYNGRNERIVKRNTIITNNILDICKKWGKLIILARNSVRS